MPITNMVISCRNGRVGGLAVGYKLRPSTVIKALNHPLPPYSSMPTRSQGCRVCVRRHLRCDLTRPTCLRCRNSNLECDGYGAQWIDETKRTTTRFNNRAAAQERTRSTSGIRAGSTAAARPSASRTSSGMSIERPGRSSSASVERPGRSRSRSGRTTLRLARTTERCYPVREDVVVSPSVYTDEVYCTFFLDKYFSFGCYSGVIQGNKTWIFDVLQAPSNNPVANLSLRCLIRGFFGRVHRDQTLQVDASRLYSESLIALRDLIGGQLNSEDGFDLLAATTLLLQYECLANTTLGGFIKHARGLQIVIESRGPEYFRRNTKARSLFAWSRHHVHVEALRSCERSFLERDEWKAVLAGDDAAGDTNLWARTLSETAMSISGLFEDVKKLSKESEVPILSLAEIEDAFKRQIESLQEWWEEFCADTVRVPVATQQMPPEVDVTTMTDTFLRFSDLSMANTFCRYHAYQILMTAWLRRLGRLGSSVTDPEQSEGRVTFDTPAGSPEEIGTVTHAQQIRPHALAICDALPYFALPQYRHIGGLFCSFPARVAWKALPRGSEEAEWVKDSLERMSDTSGFELIRNLCQPL